MIKVYYTLLLLLTSASLCAQSAGGPHNYIKQQFDVIEYSPVITIKNPISKEIEGVNTIKLYWEIPSLDNKFYFHKENLTIDSVLYDGEKVIYQEVYEPNPINEYLAISPTNLNNEATVKIYYSGKMTSEGGNNNWGGVHYSLGVLYAMGVGFYNEYVSCTRHWMPCFDLPSDKAKYTGTFIIPDSLMAISNGQLLSKTDTLDSFTKYTWTMGDDVAATYLLTFAIGDFKEVVIPNEEPPIKVYMYDNQQSIDAGAVAFRLVPEMIKAYEDFYGVAYPFESMGYYAASRGAMEHQTLVTMSEDQIRYAAKKDDSLYITAAHELAHQWFGNLVTPYDFRDAWLNEGLASYSEYVWIDSKFSKGKNEHAKYTEELLKLRNTYINSTHVAEQDLPLYNFHRFTKNNYPSTIYQKGALVMAMIREWVGQENFKTKMNEYLVNYKNSNATTEDLKNTFGDILPQKFWDDWVYGRGFPLIDITVTQDQNQVYVIAEQRENEQGFYDLELNYYLQFDHGVSSKTHRIDQRIDTLIIGKSSWLKSLEVVDNIFLYKIMSNNLITSVEEDFQNKINLVATVVDDNLEIEFGNAGSFSVQIVTLDGKKMLFEQRIYSGIENFDLSGFAAGVYFVYISSDKFQTVKKIMVR